MHGERIPIHDNDNDIDDEMMNSTKFNKDLVDDLYELLGEMRKAQQSDDTIGGSQAEFSFLDKLIKDAQHEIYLGFKYSLLSLIVKLLHIKVLNKWTNKSFDMLLNFLKDLLPEGASFLSSYYGARKLLFSMGLDYESIEVCKYDCVHF